MPIPPRRTRARPVACSSFPATGQSASRRRWPAVPMPSCSTLKTAFPWVPSRRHPRSHRRQPWRELRGAGLPLVVRINAAESDTGPEDLEWLVRLTVGASPAAVMVPKAESPHLACACRGPHARYCAAADHRERRGLRCAVRDRRSARCAAAWWSATSTSWPTRGCSVAPTSSSCAVALSVAMATRLHRLAPAVDGVTVDIGDENRLSEDTRRALRFGFGGKLCIHPRQIDVVHAAMAPGAEEVAWARRVIEADAASGGAAVQLDGRMVDGAVRGFAGALPPPALLRAATRIAPHARGRDKLLRDIDAAFRRMRHHRPGHVVVPPPPAKRRPGAEPGPSGGRAAWPQGLAPRGQFAVPGACAARRAHEERCRYVRSRPRISPGRSPKRCHAACWRRRP